MKARIVVTGTAPTIYSAVGRIDPNTIPAGAPFALVVSRGACLELTLVANDASDSAMYLDPPRLWICKE